MKTIGMVALSLTLTLFFSGAQAQTPAATGAADGVISKIDGQPPQVTVRDASGATRKVTVGGVLRTGDRIVTTNDQTVVVTLKDQSEIAMGPQTDLTLGPVGNKGEGAGSLLKLAAGLLHAAVSKIYSKNHPFVVETPNATMGVRGTEFMAESEPGGRSSLHTFEGSVAMARNYADLNNPAATSVVKAGYSSTLTKGQRQPTAPRRFNPKTVSDYLGKRAPVLLARIQSRFGTNLSKSAEAKKEESETSKRKVTPPPPPRPKRLRGKK